MYYCSREHWTMWNWSQRKLYSEIFRLQCRGTRNVRARKDMWVTAVNDAIQDIPGHRDRICTAEGMEYFCIHRCGGMRPVDFRIDQA